MNDNPLRWLRVRLTAWYMVWFCAIVGSLGVGLFITIRHQISQQLDNSLIAAMSELKRAAQIREDEAHSAHGAVVDAFEELRIPDRTLFLLRHDGTPVKPEQAPDWVRQLARMATAAGRADTVHVDSDDVTLRAHAEAFALLSGERMVAIAAADRVELNDRYAALIAAFGGAALAALLAASAGGWFLVRKSTLPVEHSMEYMRRFMGDAAHELRTPLAVLRSRAEIALQQQRAAADYVAALEDINSESQRLGRIVDDLLLLARADTGERPIERSRIYLDDIVLDAVHSAKPIAEKKGVSLEVRDCAEAEVVGDATLLRQLAMILLDNAIKFTEVGGRISVRVGMTDGAPALAVKDTGRGISAEGLPFVFDRFHKGNREDTNTSTGAGLGLSIAKWVADAHRATIELRSHPGQGTTVAVRFPAAPSAASTALATPKGD
jgi:signal transduction histidine kinase